MTIQTICNERHQQKVWCKIRELDLTPVLKRYRWDYSEFPEELVETVEVQYRRWLFMLSLYADPSTSLGGLMPDKFTDTLWDLHILFTKHYHQSCEEVFGQYMHHWPEPDPDAEKFILFREKCYETTRKKFVLAFGEEADPEVVYAPFIKYKKFING